jgi:hypothetical protein
MARGLQKHQDYKNALSLLGKTLLRRSQRKCELSEERGELVIYDLDDPKTDPSLEHILHVSPKIRDCLDGQKINPAEMRCLETAVWSEHNAIRRAAIILLKRLDESWARDALESAMMMDDFED